MNDDERNEDHAQQCELVRSGKDLRELHEGSLEAFEVCAFLCPAPGAGFAISTVAGSKPVLLRKRCESDGKFPSGRSSSTRSMRCMGKKTTAGVNGSPSLTITVRSSKEANSAPLKLSPSAARARIIPQNFSRGLDNVAMTIAPATNRSPRWL